MATPPPPPSPDYYYYVVNLAMIVVMLVLSNIIAFACCSPWEAVQSFSRLFCRHGPVVGSPPTELIIPASKYKEDQAYGTDCSVCLMGFAEGEEVRQLPACKHSFHAPCIDRWLCSHSSCPLCRGTIAGLPLPQQQRCPRAVVARRAAGPHRPWLFTESHSMGQVVVAIM